MMETYPSRGEENHQTAFLLCALSHAAAFLYSISIYRYSLSGKRGLQDFSNIPFHSGQLHSCVHGLSYLSTEGVVHMAWSFASPCFFFFLSWCNQETQTLKSASSGFRPCQGHLIVLEYLASHSTFSQLEIKDSNLYLSWLLCRLIKTCICLYTHISSSARHTVYIQT